MLRTVLFWLHLAAGVIAGALIIVMSVTGVLLTYEKQMTHWADLRQLQAINAPLSTHLHADSLIRLAEAAKHNSHATAITLRADSAEPAQVSFGRDGVLFLDPASGTALGSGDTATRAFFSGAEEWHRWLAGEGPNRTRGKTLNDAANLLFLVLVLSGMVLWLPRTWTWVRVRAILWFRTGLSPKARDFNWHNVLGIWSAIPLIVIVASGSVIGYQWAGNLVYRVVGESPPPRTPPGPPPGARTASTTTPAPPTASLAGMISSAIPLMPDWNSVTAQVPAAGAKTASVTLDRGNGGQPQLRATVQFTAATGAIAKYQPFDSLSIGRQARSVLRFAHTGEVLGTTGQTIAGLASLASVVLVVTGISLALRRAARAYERRRAPASEPALDASAI